MIEINYIASTKSIYILFLYYFFLKINIYIIKITLNSV